MLIFYDFLESKSGVLGVILGAKMEPGEAKSRGCSWKDVAGFWAFGVVFGPQEHPGGLLGEQGAPWRAPRENQGCPGTAPGGRFGGVRSENC